LGATHPKNPLDSPLSADLNGLPPIRIHVRDDEVLLDDSRRYGERPVAAGVDVKLDIWMGMPHGFVTNVVGFNAPQGKRSISNGAARAEAELRNRFAADASNWGIFTTYGAEINNHA
jgi:acetyl esterase/lipase